ncbi:MAG: hypothetical protein AAB855_02990 [Patescibacteria group bacterium]
MATFVDSLNLEPGEEVRAVYHRHSLTLITRLYPWAFILIVLFLFLFPLFSLGVSGVVAFGVIFAVCIICALRTIAAWLGTVTILTNVRLLLVERFGFFKTRVTEMKLDQVFKVSYEIKGMRQAMGHYGTLVLVVMFTGENMYVHDIPHPQEALNQISLAVSAVTKAPQKSEAPVEKQHREPPKKPEFHSHEVHT